MKVSELHGALLDAWVARAEGNTVATHTYDGGRHYTLYFASGDTPSVPEYSTDWSAGGPIIERDQIYVQPPCDVHYNGGPNAGWKRYDEWTATVSARTRTLPPQNELSKMIGHGGVGRGAGETPLIAAMRAKVASHYGDEVPDAV